MSGGVCIDVEEELTLAFVFLLTFFSFLISSTSNFLCCLFPSGLGVTFVEAAPKEGLSLGVRGEKKLAIVLDFEGLFDGFLGDVFSFLVGEGRGEGTSGSSSSSSLAGLGDGLTGVPVTVGRGARASFLLVEERGIFEDLRAVGVWWAVEGGEGLWVRR